MAHETRVGDRVAERIRELREKRGLSVRELARRAGLRPESVSRSERGVTEVTITTLAKLCRALDLDLPGFFAFEAEPPLAGALSADVRRTVALLGALSPEQRGRVAKALEVLLGAEGEPSGVLRAATSKRRRG
jgi:transcriptional regulator with XRE-family HTH domain